MGKIEYDIKDEMKLTICEIDNWYKRSKNRVLNIVSVPFNTSLILKKAILNAISNKKNILYIWGNNIENWMLLDELKKYKSNITSSFIDNEEKNCDISFMNYHLDNKIKGNYGLVIIDDISLFSTINQDDLLRKVNELKEVSEKIIIYNIENLDLEGDIIEVIPTKGKKPYVEPRILNTRIDLNKDIPYILYEYIKWFIDSKNKIAVFTPDEEKLNSVYEYYTKKLKMKRIKVVPLLRSENKRVVKDVLNNTDKATIIITNIMEAKLEESKIGNAIVLFADSNKYTYKQLLFLCSEIGRINEDLPEILLVSKEVSEDIEKVKSITRHYNKVKWERNGEI